MINRTSQVLPSEVPRRLAAAEKAVRDLKNKQFLGGDNFVLDITGDTTIGPITLVGGGGRYTAIVNFVNFQLHDYFLSELGVSIFVNVDNSASHHWPDGSALEVPPVTSGLEVYWHYDPYLSDEPGAGRKTYIIKIVNDSGTVSNDYYIHVRLIFPVSQIS